MRATLIFNPAAGQREVRAHLHNVVGYLVQEGWAMQWRETAPDVSATVLAQQALAEGSEVVIAAGGDGTINEVVNGLVGHPTVQMGILPTGTANVWARESGIVNASLLGPNLEAAGTVLREGVPIAIDVGLAGDRYFLLMAGIGFDALVTQQTSKELKKQVGPFAYAWTATREALRYRGANFHITVDGKTFRRNAWLVTISNARLYALVPLAVDASVTDGELDIGIFRGHGWPRILRHATAIAVGRHIADPEVEFLRGSRIHIRARPALPVQVDAEPIASTPMTFSVVPRALRIIVPRDMASALMQNGSPKSAAVQSP